MRGESGSCEKLERSDIVLPVLALRCLGAEGSEKVSPINELEVGLLAAVALFETEDNELFSCDFSEEFSLLSVCCCFSSSSDFLAFLGAPKALNQALKLGFSLAASAAVVEALLFESTAFSLAVVGEFAEVKVVAFKADNVAVKVSKGLGFSADEVDFKSSSNFLSFSSFVSKCVELVSEEPILGNGSKPSKMFSFGFVFSSNSFSFSLFKAGLNAALFTVFEANSSMNEGVEPMAKSSVFITVPKLNFGTLSAVSTIKEFLTSLVLAATGPRGNSSSGLLTFCIRFPLALPGCKRSIVRNKLSFLLVFEAACSFSFRDFLLSSFAICFLM